MVKKEAVSQIIIVGSGISGCTLAERYASLGKRVLVIEKRDHIGGNCYDFINADGLLVNRYGAHLFHTNNEKVWKYVQRFSKWSPYSHKVLARVDSKLVPVPVNIETVNKIFSLNIKTQSEMNNWLEKNQIPFRNPKNSEEIALSRVGKDLYEKMFKKYTIKQWDKQPKDLDPIILSRIPVRNNFDDRYFTDKYQFQPVNGFTKLFEKMIDHENITVLKNTDFFSIRDSLGDFEKLFYSGPIDQFFNYIDGHHKLEYRSLKFKFETHDKEFFQKNSVINYPNNYKFTRIVEFKHITGQKHSKTTIAREYPTWEGEPYYPVLTHKNRLLYKKFQKLSQDFKNVYFIGRLGEFRYINMDEAFSRALHLFESLESYGKT